MASRASGESLGLDYRRARSVLLRWTRLHPTTRQPQAYMMHRTRYGPNVTKTQLTPVRALSTARNVPTAKAFVAAGVAGVSIAAAGECWV